MRVFERLRNAMGHPPEHVLFYDKIDIKNTYTAGFWIGSVAGGVSVFVTLLLVGLFLHS